MDPREWPWRLITAILRAVVWVLFVLFALLVVFGWVSSRSNNLMSQINTTSLTLTYLFFGYALARAFDAVTRW